MPEMFTSFDAAQAKRQPNQELPLVIGDDSIVWQSDGAEVKKLAREFVQRQFDNDHKMFTALTDLVETMADLAGPADQTPPQIVGRIQQPDGTPAGQVQVSLELAGVSTTLDGVVEIRAQRHGARCRSGRHWGFRDRSPPEPLWQAPAERSAASNRPHQDG